MTRATRRAADPARDAPPTDVGGVPTVGRPVPLVASCALVLVQAALPVGLAGALLVDLVRGAVEMPAATVFLVLFALGVAAVLVLAVRGLWAGRRWARSPVMTWQVLLVVLSLGWLGSEPAWWALAVLLSALGVGVGLLLPSVVAATADRSGRDPDPGSDPDPRSDPVGG